MGRAQGKVEEALEDLQVVLSAAPEHSQACKLRAECDKALDRKRREEERRRCEEEERRRYEAAPRHKIAIREVDDEDDEDDGDDAGMDKKAMDDAREVRTCAHVVLKDSYRGVWGGGGWRNERREKKARRR